MGIDKGTRMELRTVLQDEFKMDLARQLASIQRVDLVPIDLPKSEIIALLLQELSDAEVSSMLAAYAAVSNAL